MSTGEPLSNDVSVSWKKVGVGKSFPAREGQCCCGHKKRLYVFGGVLQGEELTESNDLLIYDLEGNRWQKVTCKGDIPAPRTAASLVAVQNKLYLFGGLSHMTGWFNDFFVFDIETQTWSARQTEQCPSARDKLQGVAVGNCIYYFGGFGPKSLDDDMDEEWEDEDDDDEEDNGIPGDQEAAEFGWFNDLHVYDTVTEKWSQPMQMNLGVPSPRAAHGMCSVGNKIIIFGGKDTEARQNDLHIFNTDSRKWETDMVVKGRPPEPRSFHSTTAVGKRVVVMGGRGREDQHFADFHIFDTETYEWLQPNLSGDLPCERGQHSAAVTGDALILYGGTTNYSAEIMQCQQFLTDTYVTSTAKVLKGGAVKQQNGHDPQAVSAS